MITERERWSGVDAGLEWTLECAGRMTGIDVEVNAGRWKLEGGRW